MSVMAGNALHPERVTTLRTSTGAPHLGQLAADASDPCLHRGQMYGVALIDYSV